MNSSPEASGPPRLWLALDGVREVLDRISDADNALDELLLECRGLVDPNDPWHQPPDNVPTPTAEDVAALSVLCEAATEDIGFMRSKLDQIETLRKVATFRYGTSEAAL